MSDPRRPDVEDGALRPLAAVYAALALLREGAARGEPPPPLAELRALADDLPGALRILDQMPADELSARAAELARARAPGAPRPDWVATSLAWRAVMRAALALRRAAGRERSLARARLASAHAGWSHGPVDERDLEAIVRPTDGRLVVWALGRVAVLVERPADAVERDVFGPMRVSALARSSRGEAAASPLRAPRR